VKLDIGRYRFFIGRTTYVAWYTTHFTAKVSRGDQKRKVDKHISIFIPFLHLGMFRKLKGENWKGSEHNLSRKGKGETDDDQRN
jgi:hypothetical protein